MGGLYVVRPKEPRALRGSLWGTGTGGTQNSLAEMDNLEEVVRTAEEVLGKRKSHQLFQSKWDTAAFIIFLIFVGEYGLCLWPISLPYHP